MTLVTNTTAETIATGQSITFDRILLKTGEGECCRSNVTRVPSVKMKKCGNYKLEFSGNIAGVSADQIQLAIAVDGTILPETTMIVTPAAADEYFNVHTSTVVSNDCATTSVTVVNTGLIGITVAANSNLMLTRVSG